MRLHPERDASLALSAAPSPVGVLPPERRRVRSDRRHKKSGRRQDERAHEASDHRASAIGPRLSPETEAEQGSVFQGDLAERMDEVLRRLSAAPQETEWLTAAQAAAHLGLSVRALYSAVERRQVPTVRLGRRLRFNRAGLDRLLSGPRGGALRPRVPSPGKESERW